MYNNKWFPLIVFICMGCFIASCSKYSSRSTMGGSGDHRARASLATLNWNIDGNNKWQIKRDDNKPFNWYTIDLCQVDDQKTLLCHAIEAGNLDLLRKYLEAIKNDPKKYPIQKVIHLIAGPENEIKDMKMPLLMRVVSKSGPDHKHNQGIILGMLKALFDTLRSCSLKACEEVFFLKIGDEQYTIIHEVIEGCNLTILKYLIDQYIEIKKAQGLAGVYLSNSVVEILSTRNKINATPIRLLVQNCSLLAPQPRLKMLEYLSKYLIYFSESEIKSELGPIFDAIVSRSNTTLLKDIIKAILKGSTQINKEQGKEMARRIVDLSDAHGRTLLHYVVICEGAKQSRPDTVEYLMELGASCTCFDKNGISPLFIAIAFGALHIVELLLDQTFFQNAWLQWDINKQGTNGLTPLNFAVYGKDKVIVSVISKLFDTFVKNCDQYADQENINRSILIGKVDPHIVKSLLNAGASVVIKNNADEMPIHRVVKNNKNLDHKIITNVIELLLSAGANPLEKNFKKYNALDIVLDQIPSKATKGGHQITINHVLALLTCKAITLTQANAQVNFMDKYMDMDNTIYMNMYMDIDLIYRHGDHKGERAPLQQALASFLESHNIEINAQYKNGQKPSNVDANTGCVVDTKRKQKSVQQCDGSGSGRSHAT